MRRRAGTRTTVSLATLVAFVAILVLASGCEPDEAEPDVADQLERIAEEVAELRGLPLAEPIDGEVLDDDAFAALLAEVTEERAATSQAATASEELLRALRHLGPDETVAPEDVGEVADGVYVPEHETFYVREQGDEGLGGLGQVVAAHEIQHALQDRHVGLDRLIDLGQGTDVEAFLGFNAVVEGDATAVQEAWSREAQDPEDRAGYLASGEDLSEDALAAIEALPAYVLDQLQFVYVDGAEFVEALREDGGWGAVDDALADPPATSYEVYHPEAFLTGFEPADVTVAGDPGEGWEEQWRGSFGAFDTFALLGHADRLTAAGLVRAWRGGEVALWRAGDEVAVALRLSVDDADEATDEACALMADWYVDAAEAEPAGAAAALEALLAAGDEREDVLAVACDGGDIAAGLAPDEETARALADQ